ncbi:Insulinoma-associated protein [Schistosoma japonicum]|uniref:Insulinoma-associated protein n=1 Tax=Schistosoma japonicum TaxID=6182 RepID=A0A4Z2DFC0_SCHJA|nr:Insulinoma-associated protein 1a [Schistosoma japonicum]TNN14940.1 Insulinoma-associated protein [Schistosoma japonicum]
MSFRPRLKSDYIDGNSNFETQTRIINFFSTYKQLLDRHTRQLVNELSDTKPCMNFSTTDYLNKINNSNNMIQLMNCNSIENRQCTTTSEPNTMFSFKSPTIGSLRNPELRSDLSTCNLMNSTFKFPQLNEFTLRTSDSQCTLNDLIKNYSNSNCLKTKHYSYDNSCSKLLISEIHGKVYNKCHPLSSSSTSSIIPSSTKLSTSLLTTLTNTTTTSSSASSSSSPSLSNGSINPTTNISKHLTVQKILKRLAKLPNNLGPYICRLCNQYFENALKLANHRCPLILHTDYRCPECDKVFSCPANLASHRRWHKPKPNSHYDQITTVENQPTFSISNNCNYLTERKYYDYNYKKLSTNSKLLNTRTHLSKNNVNSIEFHAKQEIQPNRTILSPNVTRKPNFTVQALLEDSIHSNDKSQNTIKGMNNNIKLNGDETVIGFYSLPSVSDIQSSSMKFNLPSCNSVTICTTGNNNVNSNVITATPSSMYNAHHYSTNKEISFKCNYCNTPLSTRSELETHSIEHIFSRLKSEKGIH